MWVGSPHKGPAAARHFFDATAAQRSEYLRNTMATARALRANYLRNLIARGFAACRGHRPSDDAKRGRGGVEASAGAAAHASGLAEQITETFREAT